MIAKARKPIGNEYEQVLAYQCIADGLTDFEQNYVFHEKRKYEIDVAFVSQRVGVEIEGGVWTKGAHGRPVGIIRDMEKHNLLILSGWRVLRYTPDEVKHGDAIEGLKSILVRRIR